MDDETYNTDGEWVDPTLFQGVRSMNLSTDPLYTREIPGSRRTRLTDIFGETLVIDYFPDQDAVAVWVESDRNDPEYAGPRGSATLLREAVSQ